MSSRSIVKDSTKLRDALKSRWKELKMSQVAVERDAIEHGQPRIIRQAINKYLHNPYAKGALNESQLVWLAYRYLVPVTLAVGIPNKSGVKYEIPKYNEKRALELLSELFPEKKAKK